jgi:hypothetical protein
VGAHYAISPAGRAKYADNGRRLTDGITQGGYVSGNTIGWTARGKDVAVCFDLGRPRAISDVQAFTQGGGFGAVEWPDHATAFFSASTPPPSATIGRGSLPNGILCVPAGPLVVDKRRSSMDMDGHLRFHPNKAMRARYVTLVMTSSSWLMLSEVRIISNGRNIAPSASYYSRPKAGAPSSEETSYVDDGVMLTDGVVAEAFADDRVAGWEDDAVHTVTLDLGKARNVREITAWSLMGGSDGIYAPRSVTIDVSADGKTWSSAGEIRPSVIEDKKMSRAIPCRARLAAPVRARFVRVRVTRARDWVMLSEIQVH